MSIFQLNSSFSLPSTLSPANIKTTSGYLKLPSEQINCSKIKILLQKTRHYLSHAVHFTLIVSTSDHKYRLDMGVTHYETFEAVEQKTFVIELEGKDNSELSLGFYDLMD